MDNNNALKEKLKSLPQGPGIYFHKDKQGKVIYIGKAAVLRNRVRQYFQTSKNRDPKTESLVAEIHDTDWIELDSEIDALFLEAEMVRRYLPPYNILLRDDKSLMYVRIDPKSIRPTVSFTRRPLDDSADYYGPYINGWAVKRALKHLRRVFPYLTAKNSYATGSNKNFRSRLYVQIGLEPRLGSEDDLKTYRTNLKLLAKYMTGQKTDIAKKIEKNMQQAAVNQQFELAASLRNKLMALKGLNKQIIFSDREFLDISKDLGLGQLTEILNLKQIPKRIEGYDISHMGGRDVVASMVVFSSGIPDKTAYRKFRLKVQQNNDFASMHEIINRRLSDKNRKSWGLPNLFLIDGGKGQLGSALKARDSNAIDIPMIGLAKREEEIVISKHSFENIAEISAKAKQMGAMVRTSEDYYLIELPKDSHVVKLLQRIRDESHRFAVSYHSVLKTNRQTTSWLDEVPGIGPASKKKLIKTFGSSRAVIQARDFELQKTIGNAKTEILKQYIRAEKKLAKHKVSVY